MTRSTWSGWWTASPHIDNVNWSQLAPGSRVLELYSEVAQELRKESSSQDGTADGMGSRGWTPIGNNRTHGQERQWGHGMPDWLLCPASQIEYSFLIKQSPDSRVCRSGAACPWLIFWLSLSPLLLLLQKLQTSGSQEVPLSHGKVWNRYGPSGKRPCLNWLIFFYPLMVESWNENSLLIQRDAKNSTLQNAEWEASHHLVLRFFPSSIFFNVPFKYAAFLLAKM